MIKKVSIYIFSAILFAGPTCNALASWAKAFSVAGSNSGGVYPIQDCHYFLWLTSGTGITRTLQVSELDSEGEPLWSKVITGSGENRLYLIPLDNGYFVYGINKSESAGWDILWEKFDSSWKKIYGNIFGGAKDESGSVSFTDDGGFLISGTTKSYLADGSDQDMLLIKVNSSGEIVWNKAIHYGLKDGSPAITEVSDGYLFTASVENNTVPGTPGQDILVAKVDNSGNILWKKIYQGSIEEGTWINAVSAPQELNGGGYLLWGSTKLFSSGMGGDILLIKMDSSGNILWQKRYYDESSNQQGLVYYVRENPDGSLLLNGVIMNVGDYLSSDILLMKLTSNGDIVWKKTLIGPGYDVAGLTETSDGNYLLSGATRNYTEPPYDSGNIFYAKIGIDLDNGSITYPWGTAKIFGSTGVETGSVIESYGQYLLFGNTNSWGIGTMSALGAFYLDENGVIPGCEYFQDINLTEGTANLTASDTNLSISIPALTERQVGTAGEVNLTVTATTNPTVTNICSTAISDIYSIAGTITYNGAALSNVTVTLTSEGITRIATTDDDGEYCFTGLSSGTYTITPSKTGYTFTPTSKSVTTSCPLQLGVDFTATQSTGGGCDTWTDVITKYNQYTEDKASWIDVISCYTEYTK